MMFSVLRDSTVSSRKEWVCLFSPNILETPFSSHNAFSHFKSEIGRSLRRRSSPTAFGAWLKTAVLKRHFVATESCREQSSRRTSRAPKITPKEVHNEIAYDVPSADHYRVTAHQTAKQVIINASLATVILGGGRLWGASGGRGARFLICTDSSLSAFQQVLYSSPTLLKCILYVYETQGEAS